MQVQTLKSEASANEILAYQMQAFEYERKQWEKVLKVAVKPTQRRQVKQGFFARLFKVA